MPLNDAAARARALDVGASFIVQAPAGSGKTELLVQRYLALLAIVEKPESVLAITFTKKAAAEMRVRVLDALRLGQGDMPAEPHKKTTYQLAKAVLAQDALLTWNLMACPMRMRLTTIDSLCARLTQSMPLLSRCGAMPEVLESALPLYESAVTALFDSAQEDLELQSALSHVLIFLDNRVDRVQSLLTGMLARRDQWVEVVYRARAQRNLRAHLEASLGHVVMRLTAQAFVSFDVGAKATLNGLLLSQGFGELSEHLESVPAWQRVREWLLTAKGTPRKSITVRQGFDKTQAESKAMLRDMAANLPQTAIDALMDVASAPTRVYSDQAWSVLDGLLTLLPHALAHLRVVFAAHHSVDFAEVSQSALYALEDEGGATELAVKTDAAIQHILVDEFQDTSDVQFRLLLALTQGWDVSDGRTLFLVGDPQQSIYRFRQADVGLFLRAIEEGVGPIALKFLQLTTNFRSCAEVVGWCNETFKYIFPTHNDARLGAVQYSEAVPASSIIDDDAQKGIHQHFLPNATPEEHAEQVAMLAKAALEQGEDKTVAILLRSRTDVPAILAACKAEGVPVRVNDVDSLFDKPYIQDVLSLTYALLYPADKLSWWAVLRSPLCNVGLPLLLSMSDASAEQSFPLYLATRPESWAQTLAGAHAHKGQQPLALQLQTLWADLGAQALLSNEARSHLETYYGLLDTYMQGADLPSRKAFERALQSHRVGGGAEHTHAVELMTMHKSKGLEFDTVILPGLHKSTRGDDQPLMLFDEWLHNTDEGAYKSRLIMAPLTPVYNTADPIYRYLHRLEQQRTQLETARVLYVACTRAKTHLHVVAVVETTEDGEIKPATKRSLLCLLS
jgi:ATP-dependent helicase/nuclease subunit A